MKIVIDISDEDYKAICGHIKKIETKNGEGIKSWYNLPMRFESAIYHGKPLPKGHGRLIDADKLKKHKYHDNDRFENAVAVAQIDWADTIIEADAKSDGDDSEDIPMEYFESGGC